MPKQEVTNTSQGRVIHIDGLMLLPGDTGRIDAERAKSGPVQNKVKANDLKLGAVVADDDDGEEAESKSQAQQPKAAHPGQTTQSPQKPAEPKR